MAIARQPTRSSTLAARIASARCSPGVRSTSKRMSEVNSIGGLADPIASSSQGSRTGLQAQGPPAASASLWRFALVVHGNTDGLEATFRLLSDRKQTSRCIAKPSRLPSRPREFPPEPLTDPDLILSHHPARAID